MIGKQIYFAAGELTVGELFGIEPLCYMMRAYSVLIFAIAMAMFLVTVKACWDAFWWYRRKRKDGSQGDENTDNTDSTGA